MKNKIEYSKRIVTIVTIFSVITILFSMALMWKTGDTSGLTYLIPSVLGEASVVIGFYLKKAERENINKHKGSVENEEDKLGGETNF